MNAALKVLVGALMIVVGVFSTTSFWNELVALVKAAAGPLLVLVGAFIVWIESDELKTEVETKKEEEEDEKTGLQREFQPQEAVQSGEPEKDYEDLLSGTVRDVKDGVRDMEHPDYEAILEAEEQGKDRKTVKNFLERRIG
ncbi:MAG: hypothetical protein ABEJ03_00510 [Candidatus Nanohaloarchaea archaeon]